MFVFEACYMFNKQYDRQSILLHMTKIQKTNSEW